MGDIICCCTELWFCCVALLVLLAVKVEESSRCKVGACKEVTVWGLPRYERCVPDRDGVAENKGRDQLIGPSM